MTTRPTPKNPKGSSQKVHSDEHITWLRGWHGPLEDSFYKHADVPLPTRGWLRVRWVHVGVTHVSQAIPLSCWSPTAPGPPPEKMVGAV